MKLVMKFEVWAMDARKMSFMESDPLIRLVAS
jgi:hypothetical protein